MSILLIDIIEDIFGEHRKYNEDTGQVSVDCPACSAERGMPQGDGKGNLEINYNLGKYKCWSCFETNNMYGSVMKLLKKYASPKNIRDYLLLKPETDLLLAKEYVEVDLELPVGYKKLSECTHKDYKSDLALQYLKGKGKGERGLTDDIIKEFNIGYTYRGDFFNRIIIPSYDSNGKLNYFIARWFSKEPTKLKYINPSAEKQKIIFNEGKINWDATIYLVEGATDHIVTPNSIPLLGKFLSPELLEMLHDKASSYIVIVLDGDAYEDAKFIYKQLNFGNLRGRIKIVRPPFDIDPSEIFKRLGKKGITNLLKGAYHIPENQLY